MTPEQRYEMHLDWLVQARARMERFPDHVPPVVMHRAEALRLLACTEALRELVALRESRVLMDAPGVEAAWERARRALAGADQ